MLSRGKLRALDAQFGRRGLLVIVLCRLLLALPFAAVNYAASVTRIRLMPFLAGTAVGTLPANSVYVTIKGALVVNSSGLWLNAAAAGLIAIGAGLAWLGRKYRARLFATAPETRDESSQRPTHSC